VPGPDRTPRRDWENAAGATITRMRRKALRKRVGLDMSIGRVLAVNVPYAPATDESELTWLAKTSLKSAPGRRARNRSTIAGPSIPSL